MSSHHSFRVLGRGKGRGSWRGGGSQAGQTQTLAPPMPLGPAIDNISIETLLIEDVAPRIKDVKYVASYNWLNGVSPTILVPGPSQILDHQIHLGD
jgi:hypothetical protein